MSWTAPRSYSPGELITAAILNVHLRDNLLMTAPAVMSAQGDIVIASGANTPARLAKSTTSTQYLANTGTSNAPAWNEVALTTGVSGVLPLGNGGLNASSLADKAALVTSDVSLDFVLLETGDRLLLEDSDRLGLEGDGDTVGAVVMDASGEVLIGGASGPVAATIAAGNRVAISTGDGSITATATTFKGSQTTEATSTSAPAVDLLSATGLSITAAEPFRVMVACRKTAGAGGDATMGLKLNSTVVGEAVNNEYADTTQTSVWSSGNANGVNSGLAYVGIPPRVANYLRAATGFFTSIDVTNSTRLSNELIPAKTADMPTATITSVIIRGDNADGANTMGADELHVHS